MKNYKVTYTTPDGAMCVVIAGMYAVQEFTQRVQSDGQIVLGITEV